MNVLELIQELNLDIDIAIPVNPSVQDTSVDADKRMDLESVLLEYHNLNETLALIQDRVSATREEIMHKLIAYDISEIDTRYGKVRMMPEQTRISYPKADLEAIASNNKTLRKILDNIARTSVVKPHIRIQVHK